MENEQQRFWSETYADDYIAKNSDFNQELGVEAWQKMLAGTSGIENVLECGSNIGRNIGFLNAVLPNAAKNVIELSPAAYRQVTSSYPLNQSFNGPIVNAPFQPDSFDLVYTMGVLIHISPNDLIANMRKMHQISKKYILIGEYFNRTPVMIEYQGERDKLFKCDFGNVFMENFDVSIVDYGFLWGKIYDASGFDDITWWLFEKR